MSGHSSPSAFWKIPRNPAKAENSICIYALPHANVPYLHMSTVFTYIHVACEKNAVVRPVQSDLRQIIIIAWQCMMWQHFVVIKNNLHRTSCWKFHPSPENCQKNERIFLNELISLTFCLFVVYSVSIGHLHALIAPLLFKSCHPRATVAKAVITKLSPQSCHCSRLSSQSWHSKSVIAKVVITKLSPQSCLRQGCHHKLLSLTGIAKVSQSFHSKAFVPKVVFTKL